MSSTAGAGVATPGPAPWKATFLEYVNKMDPAAFVLSTVSPAPAGSPTPYVPHARYCIFRGMWAELPENKHNEAPVNDRVFESELPTFTTDVRMRKVPELFATSAGHAESREQTTGSGGGGPVEAVWWYLGGGEQHQWRIKGEAYVVAEDIEGDGQESSGVRTVKSEISKRMHVVKPGQEGEWSWSKELTGHFGNCSPGMRGTWKNPPPGTPKDQEYNDKEESLGNKVSDLHDPVARRNFRVVIIKPDEVEHADISDPAKSLRKVYKYNKESGDWSTTETWP